MQAIYLDHNSTTPLAAEAVDAMAPWQHQQFGNPASQHAPGRRARQAVEQAREEIGRILGARMTGRHPDRVVFTSGGTEANNLALWGLTGALIANEPGGLAVSTIEHPSVLAAAELLARRGWHVERLPVNAAGVVDLAQVDEQLAKIAGYPRRLLSVMLANNETGAIQPVAELARRALERGILLHTDAVQMAGKLPLDFAGLGCAALSVAAHKFHGPLGIGALVVRPDVELEPVIRGGFQQAGLRGGTESVALAVGMHAALAAWQREQDERIHRMSTLRDRLEQALQQALPGRVVINAAASPRLPQTSSLAIRGCDRQALVMALDLAGVACSTGSACASGSSEPSTVLLAMGVERDVLAGSLRFSLGAGTTAAEIDTAVERIVSAAARLSATKPARGTTASKNS